MQAVEERSLTAHRISEDNLVSGTPSVISGMSHGLRWIVYETLESKKAPTDVDTFFFSSCPRLIIPFLFDSLERVVA
uniref:Uncharacterized protein n=1 Tax=Helianthus annuus TaxID=4232 RepID=A0A251T689_HELAN